MNSYLVCIFVIGIAFIVVSVALRMTLKLMIFLVIRNEFPFSYGCKNISTGALGYGCRFPDCEDS